MDIVSKILVICDKHSYLELLIKEFEGRSEFETYVMNDYHNRLLNEYNELNPDIILIDLDITKSDPIFFIKKILMTKLVPIIAFNSITQKGRHLALKSLEYGAIDFIEKPFKYEEYTLNQNFEKIFRLIRIKNKINLEVFKNRIQLIPELRNYQISISDKELNEKIIIICSGKGAVYSLSYIFSNLPERFPPIIVIHRLPTGYTVILSNKLDDLSKLKVKEAEHNEKLLNSMVYIPPMDFHTRIVKSYNNNLLYIDKGELINGLRPSFELLLSSAIEAYQNNIIALQLSGIHNDGIAALKELHRKGAKILIESEETAIFPNMIEKIKENEVYDFEIPLQDIPEKLIKMIGS